MVDANILFSGLVWRRWPHEVLQHAARGDFRLVLCQQVIDEATERLTAFFPEQPRRLQRFISSVAFALEPHPGPRQIARNKSLLPHPDDVAIALAALNAKVDHFVSEHKHFTVANESSAEFHRKVRVLISGTFLREVMGWSSEQLEKVRQRV